MAKGNSVSVKEEFFRRVAKTGDSFSSFLGLIYIYISVNMPVIYLVVFRGTGFSIPAYKKWDASFAGSMGSHHHPYEAINFSSAEL